MHNQSTSNKHMVHTFRGSSVGQSLGEEHHQGDSTKQVCILRGGRFDICLPDLLQCAFLPQAHYHAFIFFDLSAQVHLDLIANSDTRRDDKLFHHNSKTNADPRLDDFFFWQLLSKMGPAEPLFYRLPQVNRYQPVTWLISQRGGKRSSFVAPWGW